MRRQLLSPTLETMRRDGDDPQGAEVGRAYQNRASEYIELFGETSSMAPDDVETIRQWGTTVTGAVVDAGCGPGHWAHYLHTLGISVRGIDAVPAFIAHATANFPDIGFVRGDLATLPFATGSLSGILAWYSLIHFPPTQLPDVLAEFARCLRPGGTILLGYFDGDRFGAFPHAVTTAYTWPVDGICHLLHDAGLTVTMTVTRHGEGSRPHGAVAARLTLP